ncbi:hypothetical protein [Planomonospora venezuelensis]|uniref:Uncharacterized protein n=1 Tax=Planomonospora venezuelensis TaxID=1999 RepID=A0A841D4F9_PLAVE|nr:hypothetical protein [Planomonospora venezuelensis]MBB5963384.1 hypothetical protein [Planomonospora venezuelensis]GIN05726.1 hypothetical protein Pve01_73840 [Planomonospora venezuelensis]
MILDRNNTEFGAAFDGSDDLDELRRLLFDAVPGPTEEETGDMFAQTFSADEADLSLLPDEDVLSGDSAPDAQDPAGEPGPFGEDGSFGGEDRGDAQDAGHEDAGHEDYGDHSGDQDGDHGEDPYTPDDDHGGWDDPIFGGGV